MTHTANCVLLVLGGACSCGAANAEMRELAGRMAADEARNGDFAAAAELKSFAESPTADNWLRAAETPEPVYTCHVCLQTYALISGMLLEHNHIGTQRRCSGSGQVPVPVVPGGAGKPVPWDHPDADPARDLAAFIQAGKDAGWTTSGMPKPVVGPTAARALREAGVPEEAFVERSPELGGFTIGQGAVGGQLPCGPPKSIPELDAVAARVSTVDWSVLGPGLVAAMQARQHVWNAGAGSLRDCYCLHGRDHTEAPLSELQAWMNAPRSGKTQIQEDIERAVATVDAAPAFRAPEPPIVSHAAVEQALVEDIRGTFAAVLLSSSEQERLARQLGARGWVPGAKRRADAVDEVTTLKERVLGARGDVVGHVWPMPQRPGRWYGESTHHGELETPRFTRRDEAIGWVLEQDKEAHRG